MNARLRFGLIVLLALAVSGATSAHAGQLRFFIAGTWTGSIKCKGVNGGAKEKLTLPATMRVAQDGLTVGLAVDLGGGQVASYTGVANPDAAKPDKKGELAIIRCGTDDQVGVADFDEIGRMSIASKIGQVKASFKGTSILAGFSDPGPAPAKGYTCKWKFVRTTFDGSDGLDTSCGQAMV